MKTRSLQPEIMDQPNPPADIARQFHRDLALINRLMGNWDQIAKRLEPDLPLQHVLDIGCGDGAMLQYLQKNLKIPHVTGVDLKPPSCMVRGIPVVTADATTDQLPAADVAVCALLLHHLTDEQVIALIRNAGRSARRFVALDPVRHPLPLLLYRLFFCPLLSRVGAADGIQSIRRSFRSTELRALAETAVAGTGARVNLWTSRIYARQILDVRF